MAELEKLLCTDSKVESLKKINAIIENGGGGLGLQLFDTILKDHVLTYEESKGLALQGTYVYKEAIAGSRYGYPDFYNKCLEEYNEVTNTETVNGVTVKVHSNGHKFYDISDKTVIDGFFNTMGFAWFYGVDTENERIFLPRNNYFDQVTGNISEVGQSVEAGLPNITGTYSGVNTGASGAMSQWSQGRGYTNYGANNGDMAYGDFDASRSSSIYGNSNTVQPNAVKKLLYICVGNTTSYEGMTEVVNQGMEILEQVNQGIESRANIDASNFTAQGKSLIATFPTPDYENGIKIWEAVTASTYTVDKVGWYYIYCAKANTSGSTQCLINGFTITAGQYGAAQGTVFSTCLPCSIGDVITFGNVGQAYLTYFPFKGGA